jgi:hypothetical protein
MTDNGNKTTKKSRTTAKSRRGAEQRPPAQPSPPRGEAAGVGLSLRSPAASPAVPRPPAHAAFMDQIRSEKPAADMEVMCMLCRWRGELGECEEKNLSSDQVIGEDMVTGGWSWHCPKCKATVQVYAWRRLV